MKTGKKSIGSEKKEQQVAGIHSKISQRSIKQSQTLITIRADRCVPIDSERYNTPLWFSGILDNYFSKEPKQCVGRKATKEYTDSTLLSAAEKASSRSIEAEYEIVTNPAYWYYALKNDLEIKVLLNGSMTPDEIEVMQEQDSNQSYGVIEVDPYLCTPYYLRDRSLSSYLNPESLEYLGIHKTSDQIQPATITTSDDYSFLSESSSLKDEVEAEVAEAVKLYGDISRYKPACRVITGTGRWFNALTKNINLLCIITEESSVEDITDSVIDENQNRKNPNDFEKVMHAKRYYKETGCNIDRLTKKFNIEKRQMFSWLSAARVLDLPEVGQAVKHIKHIPVNASIKIVAATNTKRGGDIDIESADSKQIRALLAEHVKEHDVATDKPSVDALFSAVLKGLQKPKNETLLKGETADGEVKIKIGGGGSLKIEAKLPKDKRSLKSLSKTIEDLIVTQLKKT